MKHFRLLRASPLITLLAFTFSATAQDNDKVVILSSRVGAVITKEQRDFFHLFQQIEDFSTATFYRTPDTQYYAIFTRVNRFSQPKDTIVPYSEASLLRYSEVIEHFEALSEGKYRLGKVPGRIQVVGGGEVMRKPQQEGSLNSAPWRDYDNLPFAQTDGAAFLDDFPDWGFGFGYSAYYADLSNFADAFTKLENKYRNLGYSIQHNTMTTDVSPLRWYSLRVRFSRSITIQLEVGKSSGSDNPMLEAVSGTFIYRSEQWSFGRLFPFLGIGINAFRISGEQRYGDRISGIDSTKTYSNYYNFSYTVLQTVSAEGTQMGISFIAGFDIEPAPTFSLTPYVCYYAMPRIETKISDGEVAYVQMSSIALGARLTLNF